MPVHDALHGRQTDTEAGKLVLPVQTLDLAAAGCRERIVARESNERWRFPFLDSLAMAQAEAAPQRPAAPGGRGGRALNAERPRTV